MSDLQKTIQTLRDFNAWRRADEDMDQPDPREIGQAIDAAIEELEELNEWKTLKSWGGTPEIINDFIKGQQSRINYSQDLESILSETVRRVDRLADVLRTIAVSDWKTAGELRKMAKNGINAHINSYFNSEVKGDQP